MIRHLIVARLKLRSALEEYEGSNQLDWFTQRILEAVKAIYAARLEATASGSWTAPRRRAA